MRKETAKRTFVCALLLVAMLIPRSGDLRAQVVWTKYAGNPIISGGPAGSWYRGVGSTSVLYNTYNTDSSRYEMWFTGFATQSGARPCQIGFAVSRNGVDWTMRPDPVLAPTPGMWDSYTVECPWVIREDGLYKMWYIGGPSFPAPYIGYATSSDGITWTKYSGNPVLGPGTSPWEAGGVGPCSVLPAQGGYRMWYFGGTTAAQYGPISLGYATSADGKSWQRDTVHSPILVPGVSGSWDGYWVADPKVYFLGGRYYMWYTGSNAMFYTFQVGLATSSDGITGWVKHPDNPVLRPSPGSWDGGEIACGFVMARGDTLYMWYDGSPPSNQVWQIGIAKSLFVPVSVSGASVAPTDYVLTQNHPNPFNPSTTFKYGLPRSSRVELSVHDVLGREVATLVNEEQDAGQYEVTFGASHLSSGVYLYQLRAGDYVSVKKMLLVR